MKTEAAAKTLSLTLSPSLTEEEVKAACRRVLKQNHPDLSTNDGYHIHTAQVARNVLLKYVEKHKGLVECPKCEGTGRMRTRRGPRVKCSTCAGDGVYKPKEIKRG